MTFSVISVFSVLHRYVIARWKALIASLLGSISVAALNALSLALFAAIPQLVVTVLNPSAAQAMIAPADVSIPTTVEHIVDAIGTLVARLHASHGAVSTLVILLGGYFLTSVLTRGVQLLTDSVIVISRSRATVHMIKDVFRHLVSLSLDFFHGRRVGDLVMRVRNDTAGLAQAGFEAIHIVVSSLPLVVFYWGLLVAIDWRLAVAIGGIYAVKAALTDRLSRKLGPMSARLGIDIGRAGAKLTEDIANIAVIKAFGNERFEHTRFGVITETHHRNNVRRRIYEQVAFAIQGILQSVAIVAVALVGLSMMFQGTIQPVVLLVFLFAAMRGQEPSRKLMSAVALFHQAKGTAIRVLDILHQAPAVSDGLREAPGFSSTLALESVSYAYPSRANGASGQVNDIDLAIRKGDVIAIVGPSGAGKSTILNLLLRFCDPDRGAVVLDGINIREFTQGSYRRLFGLVTQEPLLFHASVRDNIAYGNLAGEPDDDAIVKAAQIAHVDEFAAALPHGYDTIIGDRGVQLSGGQKQRVALARAILRNPPILVLDEATSSLDSDSESLIQDSIDRFLDGRTAIIVAHRLSTIRRASRIVVMDKGRIVETGTHGELLKQHGLYHHLHEAQFTTSGSHHRITATARRADDASEALPMSAQIDTAKRP